MTALLLRRVLKPEYLFRPTQLARRMLRPRRSSPLSAVVTLPWRLPLRIAPRETIGGGIWRLGVHEIVVSEVLWRLIDPGEWALDVGANSGYFTGLMAVRCGDRGTVWSFEPHPAMRARLEANVPAWPASRCARIRIWDCALSDHAGVAHLLLPPSFELNTGTAHLGTASAGAPSIVVATRMLDELLAPGDAPTTAKIDVEGHEAKVLLGARERLAGGAFRDIVYEDHRAYPAESAAALEAHGFKIFRLGRSVFGPLLLDPRTPPEHVSWEAPNYLATRDPQRARARIAKRGWACLSARGTA